MVIRHSHKRHASWQQHQQSQILPSPPPPPPHMLLMYPPPPHMLSPQPQHHYAYSPYPYPASPPPQSSPHHHRRNSSQSSTITVDHPDWHSSHKQPQQPHPLLYSPLQPPPRHSVSFDLPSNQVYTVPSLESTTICWYTTDELERFKIQARHDTQEWMSTTSSEEEETTAQAAHCHAMERLWKNCLDHQQQQQQQQQQSMYTPYHPATMMMMTMNAPDYHPGDEVFVQDQVQQVLAKLSPHDNDCDHYIGLERWNKPVRRHKQAAMVRTLRQQASCGQSPRKRHHKRHHSYDTAAPTTILAPPPLLWSRILALVQYQTDSAC